MFYYPSPVSVFEFCLMVFQVATQKNQIILVYLSNQSTMEFLDLSVALTAKDNKEENDDFEDPPMYTVVGYLPDTLRYMYCTTVKHDIAIWDLYLRRCIRVIETGTVIHDTYIVMSWKRYAKCTIRWPLSVSLMVKKNFHSWEYLLLLSINHMSQPHTGEILELNLVWFLFYDSFNSLNWMLK